MAPARFPLRGMTAQGRPQGGCPGKSQCWNGRWAALHIVAVCVAWGGVREAGAIPVHATTLPALHLRTRLHLLAVAATTAGAASLCCCRAVLPAGRLLRWLLPIQDALNVFGTIKILLELQGRRSRSRRLRSTGQPSEGCGRASQAAAACTVRRNTAFSSFRAHVRRESERNTPRCHAPLLLVQAQQAQAAEVRAARLVGDHLPGLWVLVVLQVGPEVLKRLCVQAQRLARVQVVGAAVGQSGL